MHGEDPNFNTAGRPFLFAAIDKCSPNMVKLLLDYGANKDWDDLINDQDIITYTKIKLSDYRDTLEYQKKATPELQRETDRLQKNLKLLSSKNSNSKK